MNPALDNVPAAFDRVGTRGRSVTIDRKGIVLPKGGHFQGIQRLVTDPRRVVITSSSDSQSYVVVCNMTGDGTRGRASAPVSLAVKPLNHAGGCQTVDSVLVVGVEDDASRRQSQIQFWNVAASPSQITSLTIRRSGTPELSTAGAVGLSSYRNGAALAVATWDAKSVDFYTTDRDPFRTSGAKFNLAATWLKATADKSGWVDGNFGAYQSVNLLTQRDGTLYLVGFNRNDSGHDWMDLFLVNLGAPPAKILRKIGKKHMFCKDGCSFRHGAGIYIPSSNHFEVYAVNGYSGDHATGITIHANHFLPA